MSYPRLRSNRPKKCRDSNGHGIPSRTVSYTYIPDKLNRQSVTDNGVVTNYVPNSLNQYTTVGSQSIGYDHNFNIAGYNGATFTYDAQNRPVGGSMQAVYDGLGRCVRRTVDGVTRLFVYDEWNAFREFDESGNEVAANIYGAKADEIVARWDATLGFLFYKQDKQGSVVGLLNQNGAEVEKYSYDVFGKPTVTSRDLNSWAWKPPTDRSSFGNRFMFTGREWIAELGIYDYRNRLYHPGLGRFLQTDPIGFDAGDMNLYRYVSDDPVNQTDPDGLFAGIVSRGSALCENWIGADGLTVDAHLQRDLIDRLANQPSGLMMASVERNEGSKQGLKYAFDNYPEKGPGGRPVVDRAMKRLAQTPKGRSFKAVNHTVYIRRTDRYHPTGSYIGAKTGNHYLYLDPTNSRFYDAITFRNMSRHKGETPPDSDEGRAAVIAHEFGHILYGFGKDIDSEIRNVRYNENPARDQLGIELRPSYQGNHVPYP